MCRALFLLILGATLVACGGTSRTDSGDDDDADGDADGDTCSDPDADGYGVGDGCLGDDCDENNDDVHECDCGEDGNAHNTGCVCDSPQPEVCYEGTEGTAGVGACAPGLRTCVDGRWSSCQDQVRDEDESCDYEDNDCDGEVDDGVLGPCGDCSEDCQSLDWGPPEGTAFDPDESNSSGIVGTPEGYITLSQNAISSHLIWIANSIDGTISKFDTRTREELARFRTGPLGSSGDMWGCCGDNPSRTSVNYYGDAYVANRAFGGTASATKILADLCPDNGDGSVNTSTGGDDVLGWDDDGPEDDCIAWNTPAGNSGDLGRSIAAQVRQELDGAAHEYAWLGLYSARKYVEIDGETGELTGEEAVFPTVTPYGAAIDADGNLWSSSLGSRVGRFDTADTSDVEEIAVPSNFVYGITVDALGHVWTNGGALHRYRPEDSVWDTVAGSRYENGGVGVDAEGIVWTHHDSGTIQRVDSNDELLPLTTIASNRGGRGVAVDSDGYIWAINWARGGEDGDVTIIDPADPENVDTVCCDSISASYTYSDMTGVQLGIATAPSGTYEIIAEGCEAPEVTAWVGISWDGDLPLETGLRVEVRTAETLPELAGAVWILAGEAPPGESPLDLRAAFEEAEIDPLYYLGVRLTLLSYNRDALPIIQRVGLQRSCTNPFG